MSVTYQSIRNININNKQPSTNTKKTRNIPLNIYQIQATVFTKASSFRNTSFQITPLYLPLEKEKSTQTEWFSNTEVATQTTEIVSQEVATQTDSPPRKSYWLFGFAAAAVVATGILLSRR
jgi:hypothetical protein